MAEVIKPAIVPAAAAAAPPVPKPEPQKSGETKKVRLPVTLEGDDGTKEAGSEVTLPVEDADRLLARFGGEIVGEGAHVPRIDPAATDGEHVERRNEKLRGSKAAPTA